MTKELLLPQSWCWAAIGDTGEYLNGLAFKPSDWGSEGFPIVRIQNLTNPEKPLNRTTRVVPDEYRIGNGDLLVSWSATLDAFIWHRGEALLNQHIFLVRPNESLVEKGLLFHWLKMAIEDLQETEHLHGSTMKHINRGPFMAHQLPLPPRAEQTRIVAKLEELLSDLDAGVVELKAAQKKLGQYRQSLLKAAVEGALTAEWRKQRQAHPLPTPSPARSEGLAYQTDAALAPLPPRGGGAGGEGATPAKQLQYARELRHNQTPTEQQLWQQLRAKRFAGFKFRRQQPLGRYIVDFACMQQRLIVELDGGQHQAQQAYDAERDAWLASQGFRVLRIWNNQWYQEQDAVLEAIWQALHEQAPPLPNPSPARGEGLKTEVISLLNACQEKGALPPLPSCGAGAGGERAEDETGAQLLARILTERRARWEAKQLTKFKEQGKTPPKDWQKKYPEPVQPDTTGLPALPEGWVWASTEQVCDFITKGTTPPKDLDDGELAEVPFLRVTNLTDTGKLNFSDRVFVANSTHQGFLARSAVYPGDVLMNIVGPPLGQVSLIPSDYSEWNVNQAIAIFRAIPGVLNDFLCCWLLSPTAKQWLKKRAKTTAGQTNLTLELCRSLPISLPPEHEQIKIVEVIKTMIDASDVQQAAIEKSLKQSTAQRQNILRAAFAGELVPQDPNDEPASVLLERIRAERAEREAVKKLRGRKAKDTV